MSLLEWARLPGPSSQLSDPPAVCPHCGCKDFYQQPDFRRSLGLGFVSTASLVTFALEFSSRRLWPDWSPATRWSLVWSPMIMALVLDRWVIARSADVVLICYKCEHLFRGISKSKLVSIEAFDLEIHDRYRYAEENAQT